MSTQATSDKRPPKRVIEALMQDIDASQKKNTSLYVVLPIECNVNFKIIREKGKVKIPFTDICCTCLKTDIEFVSVNVKPQSPTLERTDSDLLRTDSDLPRTISDLPPVNVNLQNSTHKDQE